MYTVKEVRKMADFIISTCLKIRIQKNMDIIFCRNVMIYFDREYQKRLVAGFHNSLSKHGYLFIGHSETLHSISEDFMYVKLLDSPVYVPGEWK